MIRRIVIAICVPATALLTALAAAAPAGAGSTPAPGAGESGNTLEAFLEQHSTITQTGGGSQGGATPHIQLNLPPPPCLWNPIGNATTGSDAIISEWGPNPPSTYQIDQSYAQAKKLKANPVAGTWYELPVNTAAPQAIQAKCFQLPLYAWVPIGQTPPLPPIPNRSLAKFAYNKMTIPGPRLTINPAAKGFVNLGTYVWQQASSGHRHTITVSLGNQTVTVVATPSHLNISTNGSATIGSNCGAMGSHARPIGTAPKSAGQGKVPDCGALWRAPTGGATITATVNWQVTWHGTGGTGAIGGTLPPIHVEGHAGPFPVNEIQSVNGGN